MTVARIVTPSTYGDVVTAAAPVDLWPLDDAIGATSLRNIPNAGNTLSALSNVLMGAPSLLANDPNGKCMTGGRARTASNYTFAASGSIEFLCLSVQNSNTAVGAWNGTNGAMVYFTSLTLMRPYINATVQSDTTYTAGQVHHVCETWNGTTMRFYIDGVQAIAPSIGSPGTPSRVFEVGNYNTSAGTEAKGQFQWVAVYNRTLGADEVLAHSQLVVRPS